MTTRYLRPDVRVAVAIVVVLGVLFGALTLARAGHQRRAAVPIEVSRQWCGKDWQHARPGAQTLYVRNTGSVTVSVDLIDVKSGAVYGEIESLAENTTRPMRVVLGNGDFAFRCEPDGEPVLTGRAVRVTGARHPGQHAVAAVTKADMLEPLQQYQRYLDAGVRTLRADTDQLLRAAQSGDRAATERAWVRAHLQYGRLGAAYDAFGDLGDKIDTSAAGLPGGVHDPDFTGFHQIEYSLWHQAPMSQVTGQIQTLSGNVATLEGRLAHMQVQPRDYALRAHEIAEDAVRFELTGQRDYGSDTELATVSANLDGTVAALKPLRPLLRTRYPQLSQVDTWLARARADVARARRPDGSWTPLNQLSRQRRERINADMSELAEKLAPIASICTPRRTS